MKDLRAKKLELGRALREVRKYLKLTQQEVAQRAEVSVRQVRQLEQGKHSGGIETILMICEGMGVNPLVLFIYAWTKDYLSGVEQYQIAQVKGDGLTNDEVKIIANIGQTLRQKSKIKAENLSKCLYGGENSAKIIVQ